MDIGKGLGGGIESGKQEIDAMVDNILDSLISVRAKGVVTKGVDYTLLVMLLVLQIMRCEPGDWNAVLSNINNGTLDATKTDTFYSCDQNDSLISSPGVIAVVVIILAYGLFASIFVWIHATRRFKRLGHVETKVVESIYKWTGRLIIVDSIIEIPITFFWAPFMTVFIWGSFLSMVIGLSFTANYFAKMVEDPSASNTFNMSSFLVVLSLLKLTGEISQYWVMYKAAVAKQRLNVFKDSIEHTFEESKD